MVVPMKLAIATLRIDVSLDADVFKSSKSPHAKIQYRARKQAVVTAACRSLTVAVLLQLTQSQSNPALRSSPRAFCRCQTDAILPTPSRPISAADPARPLNRRHRAQCDRRRGLAG